jgi:hypothetical protein
VRLRRLRPTVSQLNPISVDSPDFLPATTFSAFNMRMGGMFLRAGKALPRTTIGTDG